MGGVAAREPHRGGQRAVVLGDLGVEGQHVVEVEDELESAPSAQLLDRIGGGCHAVVELGDGDRADRQFVGDRGHLTRRVVDQQPSPRC
jgi:hypothetical protein